MAYAKETICIQSGWKPKNGEPRVLPIYQSTTFKYESSEQMLSLIHISEPTRRTPISYAVFCLKKKKKPKPKKLDVI